MTGKINNYDTQLDESSWIFFWLPILKKKNPMNIQAKERGYQQEKKNEIGNRLSCNP